MGLYDDRLADLSEPRRNGRVAGRRAPFSPRPSPLRRPAAPPRSSEAKSAAQSLLFHRGSGWTETRAKEWAKSHGYRHGSADVTDQYIRLRQFSPNGLKANRTITLGRGIRAVVAREESMQTKEARRRTRRSSKKAPRKKTRKARRARKTHASAARRRKRSSTVMQAPRRRRKRAAPAAAPRRRRRRRTASAWRGNPEGHAKAARKGWRRKKRKKTTSRRRKTRRVRAAAVAAPRRRRRRTVRSSVMEAPRRRRRSYARASRSRSGMGVAEFGLAVVSAGLGFVIADGVDRFLATYNPASTEEMPKDKFTSNGAGTLANTLNVASTPSIARIGAAIGLIALPAVASMYVRGPYLKTSMHAATLGVSVSGFKMLWNNVLMPLLKPKDTSAASLQKSYIARLYPAEVAASVNREAKQTAVSSSGSGALSGADVGPFALSAESPYPDAAQALRREAGMQGPGGDYPTVQNTWGTGEVADYPTAAQALYKETGRTGDWQPGPPPGTGPGPQAPSSEADCACLGDNLNQYAGFVGDAQEEPLFPISQ